MTYKVIERESGKTVGKWFGKNIKFAPSLDSIWKIRSREDHAKFSFMIEFKGLSYDMAMYEVDKYDLVVEE